MKQYEEIGDKYDKDFKSMNNKINITQEEQKNVLEKIINKIEKELPIRRHFYFQKKYLIALTAASLIFIIFSFSLLNNVFHDRKESNHLVKSMTAKQIVEKHYETYNNKDFDTYYDFQSKRLKEIEKEKAGMTREEFINSYKQNWRPVKVLSIEEKSGGTEKSTTVSAKIYFPATINSYEFKQIQKFKLIKEEGEWKFDEVISYEILK
ncbi:hypothetical protein J6TS2_37960 [Heyndrickxia sporothermodurans]|nr:hypothetical protein J6TS2_37960 [Heyndrickxia sporothermodurans]